MYTDRFALCQGPFAKREARGIDERTGRGASTIRLSDYDFVSARTRRGVAIRILNVVDEFTRVAVACHLSRTIGALEVVATLT
jgi:hypothetical protein